MVGWLGAGGLVPVHRAGAEEAPNPDSMLHGETIWGPQRGASGKDADKVGQAGGAGVQVEAEGGVAIHVDGGFLGRCCGALGSK